ncbi:MAG: hypothetical protein PHR35_13130 [Kiritimatiellae bacterium]|nr:hypothetical protein [Kiritimatiellia bacterium]
MKLNRHNLFRVAIGIVIVLLVALWLTEWSRRRAIESASRALHPIRSWLEYGVSEFTMFDYQTGGTNARFGPGWYIWYDSSTGIADPPPCVRVSLGGRITGSNIPVVRETIGLTRRQRAFHLAAVAGEREDKEQQVEQSAAPLPPAPQTGPSEGAR